MTRASYFPVVAGSHSVDWLGCLDQLQRLSFSRLARIGKLVQHPF